MEKLYSRIKRIYDRPNIIISFVGIMLFYIIPFGYMFVYSFVDNPVSMHFEGLNNYISVIQSEAFRLAFRNTVLFTFCAVPLSIILSIMLVLFIENRAEKGGFLYSVILSPLVIPDDQLIDYRYEVSKITETQEY